jgi:hypothetical protein
MDAAPRPLRTIEDPFGYRVVMGFLMLGIFLCVLGALIPA